MEKINKIQAYCLSKDVSQTLTIVELEEKEFNGEKLTEGESHALSNYRTYRKKHLIDKFNSDEGFHKKYEYIRALSNLVDYSEFLKVDSKLF